MNTLTKTQHKNLKRFLSKDFYRKSLHYFHVIDGKLYATDAYIMVLTNTELEDGVYDQDFTKAECVDQTKQLYKGYNGYDIPLGINIKKIFEEHLHIENDSLENVKPFVDQLQKIGRKALKTNTKRPKLVKTQYGWFRADLLMNIMDLFKSSKKVGLQVSKQFTGGSNSLIFDDGQFIALICPIINALESDEIVDVNF